ncbi:unnamed protein product, partial [Symbiodinium sp. CCMP2456]
EATTYIALIVDEFLNSIKPWTQVKNYSTTNYETSNETAQRMQTLEEEAAKYKQRLRNAGIDVTPTKTLPLQDGSQQAEPMRAESSGHQEDPPPAQPPAKRQRLQRGDATNKKKLEQFIQEPFNVIKQADQKTMPADKHAEMDSHMTNVQKILEEARFNKSQLQEMATRTRKSAAASQLQERLRKKGAVPDLYTYDKFTQPCAVYVKIKFPKLNDSGWAVIHKETAYHYVGSTNITIAKREYNRVAKLRQLQNLKLPKTEIAIRYWKDANNYGQFSTLLLSTHKEYIDAWAEEHSLIQRWQPKLNYPFVTKELVKKAHGLVPKHQQPHTQKPSDSLARQLFKKLRRRVQGKNAALLNILPKQVQFWKILYAISSDTKQEYDVSRELRSGKHDAEAVTILYRLANHME